MLISILAIIVVLSVLILVHEFGHFFAARLVGIATPRFSLGLGPRVAGFHVGETEFVLSAIPLGGYVKMAGMEDDEAAEGLEGGTAPADAPVDPERTFDAKPIWARVLVICAGVLMNLLFAVVAFTAIGLIYGESQLATTRIAADTAQLAGPAAPLARLPASGAQVVAVAGAPVRSFTDVLSALRDAPAGPVMLTLRDTAPLTLDLPREAEARRALLSAIVPLTTPKIGRVLPDRAAARAGLRPGDVVRSINGVPVASWPDAVGVIVASPGKPLAFVVRRGGRDVALRVTPEPTRENGRVVGKIGAENDLEIVHRSLGFGEAVRAGFAQTWATAGGIATFLGRMVSGRESARQMGGILAIGEMSGEAARSGMEVFLGFLAAFSVNLAVLNILPIPILDGGHLLFLAAEGVRGRPLSVEARVRFSHVGLLIVLALMLWANANDILRKFGI